VSYFSWYMISAFSGQVYNFQHKMDVLIIYSETLISFGGHVSNSEQMLVVHFLLTLLLLPPLRLLMARRRRFDSILPYTT
jgi:hypothetical protein